MTEVEWRRWTSPVALFKCVCRQMGQRKVALYLAGCFRRVWPLLTLQASRQAVEWLERWADGQVSEEQLAEAVREGQLADRVLVPNEPALDVLLSAVANLTPTATQLLSRLEEARSLALDAQADASTAAEQRTWTGTVRGPEWQPQAHLLRCLVGNPFRPEGPNPSWLAWQGGFIPRLAQRIYDEHTFADLPVLADALEDAGCAEPVWLEHCRSHPVHARGCWVIDRLRAPLVCELLPCAEPMPFAGGFPCVRVGLRNVSGERVEVRYFAHPLERFRLHTLNELGEPLSLVRELPGGELSHTLSLAPGEGFEEPVSLAAGLPGPLTRPGTYTAWGLFTPGALEVVSRPFTYTIPFTGPGGRSSS